MRKDGGLTLIELLATIALAAILVAIAVPSYEYLSTSNRLTSEANTLVGAFEYARSTAIEDGLPVTICASTDGAHCSGSANWHTGWIVFSDANANQTVDSGDAVLAVQGAFSGSDTISPGSAPAAVTFTRQGFTPLLPGDATFAIRDGGGNSSLTRCVLLVRMGTASSELTGTGGCS